MSYYYNYYVGYKKEDKIYPLGPYDAMGKLHDVISKSSSFASELYKRFMEVKEEEVSDELRKEFESSSWTDPSKMVVNVKYLPVKDLPCGDYIKKGYFLIGDVKRYEEDEDGWFDGFYDMLSPQIYAVKLQNELQFGKNQPKVNDYGETYTEKNASDYMFYAYPDYQSEEYEASVLRYAVGVLKSYKFSDDVEYVILETEG